MAGAWPRPVVLVEADPDGGVLAARYGLGRDPGLAGLAAAMHGALPTPEAIWEHAQRLPGGVAVVVAHESGDVSSAMLAAVAGRLATWCGSVAEFDVIADCGRLRSGSPALPLVRAADAVLIAVRPQPDELYAALHQTGGLTDAPAIAGLVLVGDRPYGPDEVRSQLGVPVVGAVADDAKAARVLREGGSSRALRVSPLVRSVRSLTDEITADLGVAPRDVGDEGEESDALDEPGEVPGWNDDVLAALRVAVAADSGAQPRGQGP
jgi:hypothetical protein